VKWQDNQGHLLVAGKTLGGSGSLNGASWTKGAASQYNLLPALTGDDSWGWDEFNQCMLLAENFHPPSADQTKRKGADYHPSYQ
jgi:choline dehydrogenase-like flavoprotein